MLIGFLKRNIRISSVNSLSLGSIIKRIFNVMIGDGAIGEEELFMV
jgi:hypothetical protein